MNRSPGLEAAVLEILWDRDGWLTVREVREALAPARQVAHTTVMTALHRLWRKGELDRRQAGRGHAYRPKLTKSEHAARRMQEVLEATADAGTLTRFVDSLSDEQQAMLRRHLEER